MSSLVDLEIQYQRLSAERDALGNRYEAGEINLLSQIQDLNARIRVIVLEIESLQSVTSSGTVVRDDQAARAEGSNTVDPESGVLTLQNGRIQLPPNTTSSSNATRAVGPNSVDYGVDGTLRPIIQTQSTSPGSSQTSSGPIRVNDDSSGTVAGTAAESGSAFSPGGLPGVGAANDDNSADLGEIVITAQRPGGNTNSTVTSLNSINFDENLVPRDNVLNQYASYTYQASLYLMTKENYQLMIDTGEKSLTNAKLLVQTGGASPSSKNDFFKLDYYIDSLELKSFIAGKAVRLAHNVSDVKMTIVEPNGISFIHNLDAAVQQFFNGSPNAKKNFTSQIYLLVIRFYGYDDQGNLIRGGVSKPNVSGDPSAFVEKWYPLILTKVNFRVANKAVEYEIEAKAPPYYICASQGRGTIPFNIELSGQTLKEILAGPDTYSTRTSAAATSRTQFAIEDPRRTDLANTTPPPKANAAKSNKKTVRPGLMQALNEYQQKLVSEGKVQYPDEYEIEFALDAMSSATVTNTGLNLSATSMSTPGTAADQKLGSKQSMDPNSRVESATAGMQIVQFIDMLVRNSSYIKDQQTVVVEEKSGRNRSTGINIKNTAWYKINFCARAKMDQYDEKRNGYAYKIKYIISPYKISQLNSPYFKAPKFNGVHKQYKYWFTGENTQVLSYEESLNALYYIVLTGGDLGGATSSSNQVTANVNELLQYQPQTTSGQPTQGAEGRTNEPGANAADQLYSPSDLKEANVTIVGDPAWLQQGEAFRCIPKGASYAFSAFLPDGTINFDSQQILFEIGYNAPADYNTLTGTMDPSRGKLFQQNRASQSIYGTTQESRIYIAKEVHSHFVKGKFTQNLKGSLMIYYPDKTDEGRPPPQNIPSASKNAAPTQSAAPKYNYPRSSVTNPEQASASSLSKGVQQILQPATQADNPTLSQLQSSPVYIQAKKGGATSAAALAAARSAFAAGTNNAANFAAPGIRTGTQLIVKDQ